MCWARLFDPKSLVRAIPLIKDQGIEEWITGQRSGVWDDCYYLDFSFVSSVSSFSLVKFHVGWTIITRDFYWAQNYHDDSTRWRIILYLLFHSPFLPPWRHEGKGVGMALTRDFGSKSRAQHSRRLHCPFSLCPSPPCPCRPWLRDGSALSFMTSITALHSHSVELQDGWFMAVSWV